MDSLEVSYIGNLRCSVKKNNDGIEILTDVPAYHGGIGEMNSPVDLLAAALGTCTLSMVSSAAKRHGIELEGARIVITKEMTSEGTRRVSCIDMRLTLPSVPENLRSVLEAAAHSCPIRNSLHPDITVTMTFDWQ